MRISGKQARKVTLLKKSTIHNEYNEPVKTWTADTANTATDASGNIYPEWWDQGGKEALESGQIVAVKDIRAKCRYIPGLNESDYRLKKDGIEYDIESIKEINRREGQMLMLQTRDNQ